MKNPDDRQHSSAENSTEHRSGFVTFVGRPNVGKSTLLNALVGEKIAITSTKPQTTRKAIRGVLHRDAGELIVVDTPGLHRPRTLLGQRLNDLVQEVLTGIDVIAFCLPADQQIGPGDRFIVTEIAKYPKARRIAVVTKTDLVSKQQIAEQLQAVSELGDWEAIIPVSAVAGEQLEILIAELIALMPVSPKLYPQGFVTEESAEDRYAEMIREAILEKVREELPHSVAVTIDEVFDEEGLLKIFANVFVERDSQKAIIIGHRGSVLAQIGKDARLQIEKLAGKKVFLQLRVKVASDWQTNPKLLNRLGF